LIKCMLSIVIPTLNEEKYLPLLLKSIKKQGLKSREIIIADAGSEDKTLGIAREYKCKIVPGGLPAKGRNQGAKIAKGDLLLFLDADIILPENFLSKALEEFNSRHLDIAAFRLFPVRENKFKHFLFNTFYNVPIMLLEKILPHAATGILIKGSIFKKLNGYNEDIKLAEDHDLSRRAKKIGKYGIIKSTRIFISERRFRKDGWIRTALRYLLCELYMVFIGPVKSDMFQYDFNHYSKDNGHSAFLNFILISKKK